MSDHARFSPSAAHRWMRCPGSIVLEQAYPDTSSEHADVGTVAHYIAADCLQNGHDADKFTGLTIDQELVPNINSRVKVDRDMVADIQVYIDQIRDAAHGRELLVEQKVEFGNVIGVEDQFGTADAIIIEPSRLQVRDLKFGRGVRVEAEENEQLLIYGLGKLRELEELGFEFDEVLLAIHQPRLDHYSEWVVSMDDMDDFEQELNGAVTAAVSDSNGSEPILVPGAKQCRWCKAKATCPALARQVEQVTGADFEDLTAPVCPPLFQGTHGDDDAELAHKMNMVDLVEDWCRAVRAETEARLLAGCSVPGYKLVEGRKGTRAWRDEEEVEQVLKAMRLKVDEMYSKKVISPAVAERLLKKQSPRRWEKVAELITQSAGKPSVAPESDKRPAYSVADQFEDLSTTEEAA